MKTFISASDIETLAAQGVRELMVDEDTVLTAVAREAAAQHGIKLVAPGAANKAGFSEKPGLFAAPTAATNPAKPKGCQHGPLNAGAPASVAGAASPRPASSGGPVVDELIGAVKQMARR